MWKKASKNKVSKETEILKYWKKIHISGLDLLSVY